MPTILPTELHDQIVTAAYQSRGFTADEAAAGAKLCASASRHGIKTHNAIKALHLDDLFGSRAAGCVPAVEITKLESKYPAVQRWQANRKLGQAVAYEAMETCMALADQYGTAIVTVDDAFHYLWGGGYVIDAAQKGYLAYTCCTAALAEVVPFGGKTPTLGTNPHSWAFPTMDTLGFPICIDWATSTVAMGRVQQFAREGQQLPPDAAVDKDGNPTTDPAQVTALLPFGKHKGYGLSLINELLAAYTGGSLPTLRSRWGQGPEDEKRTPQFFFQCTRPDALACDFAQGRTQSENVQAVVNDILGPGNESCILPGQFEARAAQESDRHGGLLFTEAEIAEFAKLASEVGVELNASDLKQVD